MTKQVKKGVILVAGVGERLRPFTLDTPKSLLPINDEPILCRLLKQLKKCQLEQVCLVTGYLPERFHTTLDDALSHGWIHTPNDFPHLLQVHNKAYQTLANNESLRVGLEHMVATFPLEEGESLLVADGDVILKDHSFIQKLIENDNPDVLLVEVSDSVRAEEMKVRLDADGYVVGLDKKMDYREAHGESMGVQLFSKRTVERYLQEIERLTEEERQTLYYENVIASDPEWLRTFTIEEIPFECSKEIDFPSDLKRASELVRAWEGTS